MKIYWVENTNPVGGRFIIAKSESSAFDIGVKIGMVRDPRNLHVKQAEDGIPDRKSTRLNSSHSQQSRMPSSA